MAAPPARPDYTDYHRFSWSYTKPSPHPAIRFVTLLPLYSIIIGAFFYFLLPGASQNVDRNTQWLYITFIIGMSIILLAALHIITETLRNSRGPTIVDYQISKAGIKTNQSLIPFSALNSQNVVKLITPQLKPRADWKSQPEHHSLALPGEKSLTLHFGSHQSYQQLLHSLHHYLTS